MDNEELLDYCIQTCGFLMDTPSSNGGNINCGEVAKRFLDPAYLIQAKVYDLVPGNLAINSLGREFERKLFFCRQNLKTSTT